MFGMPVMVGVSFTQADHYHLLEKSLNVMKVWVLRLSMQLEILGMLCHLGLLLLD